MLDTSQTIPPVVTGLTYLMLSFAPELGFADAVSLLDRLGGAGLAGVVAFLIIKWLLRERDRQADKLEQMHQERLEMQDRHHKAIVELLKDGKK